MITTFHAIFIIARYVCVVLSESLLARIQNNAIKGDDHLSRRGGKYLIPSQSFFEDYGPKFFPQLYVQRYLTVKAVLEDENWKGKIRKIVEFGCANFGFFPYMKSLTGVQEVLEVDIDHDVLVNHCCRVSPLNADFLHQRPEPLQVFVIEGNIAYTDDCLDKCDAVVCIELIEHLYPDVLEEVPYTVFGVIKPLVAVFTTPNGEFNVLFPNSKGFRHEDHKFEWTREQFKNWAHNIVVRYPDYKVSFHGIGWGPFGTENVGSCSQMAVFEKYSSSLLDRSNSAQSDFLKDERIENVNHKYCLLRKNIYPFHVDSRSTREKLRDQAEYAIRIIANSSECLEEQTKNIKIPLFRILPFVSEWTESTKEIEDVLKEAGWKIGTQESGCIAVLYSIDDDSSWSKDSDPGESDNFIEPCKEDVKYEEISNWNEFENYSDEKWDCDSSDFNVQISTSNYNKWVEEPCGPSWSELPEKSNDIEDKDYIDQSTSGLINTCAIDTCENKRVCCLSTSVKSREQFLEKFSTHHVSSDIQEDSNISKFQNAELSAENSEPCVSLCDALDLESNRLNYKTKDTSKFDIPEGCDSELYNCYADASSNSSLVGMNGAAELHPILFDLSIRAADGKASEIQYSEVPVPFLKSNSSNNLYLNLQAEAQGVIKETIKKTEGLFESPVAGSVSLEEPNDRLADSGYPNSTSAQDMELDLTPEQVDELFTENDADHQPDHHSDSVSVSSRDSDSASEARHLPEPPPVPVIMPQHDVLFEEAMNVENGDVANNNRDGEGNNVVAIGALHNNDVANGGDDNAVGIVLPENLDDLIPLFAAAEDLDNDNEIELNVVEPFPPWLLNLLGLANGGGGGIVRGEDDGIAHHHESSDEEDSDRNGVLDEGLGDDYNLDSSSLSDSCPSDVGLESDIGGEVIAPNL